MEATAINYNQLLRFTTAGSVDDGKSTLIGRLLYDSKSLFEDQIAQVDSASKRRGNSELDLALFTDGLRDEREQGITIDVAYRYFTTPKRKFIIADTPGHIEYTRNMVTGASTANVALILIDARKGVVEQTKRHTFIASLLQISHIIVCVNKMDLVDYDERVFNEIVKQYESLSSKMMIKDVRYIPISALEGDNVVHRSKNMNWYQNAPLLHTLETLHISSDTNKVDARFPVQAVIRPQTEEFHDFRGYAGRIASGIFRVGDKIKVLPSGLTSEIESIYSYDEPIREAFSGMSVTMTVKDDIDIGRGALLVKEHNIPQGVSAFGAMLCWMGDEPFHPAKKYILQHACTGQKAMISAVQYKIDIDHIQRKTEEKSLEKNDIAKVFIKTLQPLYADSYDANRVTGSFILIDPVSQNTVAGGMLVGSGYEIE